MFPTIKKLAEHHLCPVCGTGLTGIEVKAQHTNGDWNEKVTYRCGAELVHSPNFSEIMFQVECPNASKIIFQIRGTKPIRTRPPGYRY